MTFIIALVFSAIGFKKYVWFISIGYGLSVAAIGVFLPLYFGAEDGMLPVIASILLILYGCRLSGYLTFREVKKASYNKKMKSEIKDGKDMSKRDLWMAHSGNDNNGMRPGYRNYGRHAEEPGKKREAEQVCRHRPV